MGYKTNKSRSRKSKKSCGGKKSRKMKMKKMMRGGYLQNISYDDLDTNGNTEYYIKVGTYVSNGYPNVATFRTFSGKKYTVDMTQENVYKKV